MSFGTTTTFTDEQITELAIGLERSRQRFIWVARAADKGDVIGEEAKMVDLPEGFEERVEGRGLVKVYQGESDQPRNAFLITDVLRIGLVVNDWQHRDELVKSVVVKDVVRRLMDSKEGEEVRKRAVELADKVQRSVEESGESRKEIDPFISHITRHI
uniref:Uncharacterized protein n=1 Tax=Lactuca sativa TaxID=4236 RepID=A0A9R1WTH1_LACSA|nr:hypothetical protein LSAT_V11C900466840 [Lactuca sativa]